MAYSYSAMLTNVAEAVAAWAVANVIIDAMYYGTISVRIMHSPLVANHGLATLTLAVKFAQRDQVKRSK